MRGTVLIVCPEMERKLLCYYVETISSHLVGMYVTIWQSVGLVSTDRSEETALLEYDTSTKAQVVYK